MTARSVVALLVAPIAFGILLWIGGAVSGNASEGLWALKAAALFGYPIALLTGVPAYLWMTQRGWVDLPAYLSLAVIYAAILSGWIFIRPTLDRPEYLNFTALALQSGAVLIGCIITLTTFWAIARPDKIES